MSSRSNRRPQQPNVPLETDNPYLFSICGYCKTQNCEHICLLCRKIKVVRIYDTFPPSEEICQCVRMQYQTPCGIIYDGNSQCACDECCSYKKPKNTSHKKKKQTSKKNSLLSDGDPSD